MWDFEYGYVIVCRYWVVIFWYLGIWCVMDWDWQVLWDELVEMFQGVFGKIENQVEFGYCKSCVWGYFVLFDKIMEWFVCGVWYDVVENFFVKIVDSLFGEICGKLEVSLVDFKCVMGFLSLKVDVGVVMFESILVVVM